MLVPVIDPVPQESQFLNFFKNLQKVVPINSNYSPDADTTFFLKKNVFFMSNGNFEVLAM